jgi:hypothetical protein
MMCDQEETLVKIGHNLSHFKFRSSPIDIMGELLEKSMESTV